MEGAKEEQGKMLAVKIIKEQGRLSRTEVKANDENSFVLITDKGAWSFFPANSSEVNKLPLEDLVAFKIELDIAEAGKKFNGFVRWKNNTDPAKSGPWTKIVSAMISD